MSDPLTYMSKPAMERALRSALAGSDQWEREARIAMHLLIAALVKQSGKVDPTRVELHIGGEDFARVALTRWTCERRAHEDGGMLIVLQAEIAPDTSAQVRLPEVL